MEETRVKMTEVHACSTFPEKPVHFIHRKLHKNEDGVTWII
jgi:hypothetical protein